jgi:hypothetical protein
MDKNTLIIIFGVIWSLVIIYMAYILMKEENERYKKQIKELEEVYNKKV